jgi:hypothetical protein
MFLEFWNKFLITGINSLASSFVLISFVFMAEPACVLIISFVFMAESAWIFFIFFYLSVMPKNKTFYFIANLVSFSSAIVFSTIFPIESFFNSLTDFRG